MELTELEARVLEIVQYYCSLHGHATRDDILGSCSLSPKAVSRAISALGSAGLVNGKIKIKIACSHDQQLVGDDAWLDEVQTGLNRRGMRSAIEKPVVPRCDTLELGSWSSILEDEE